MDNKSIQNDLNTKGFLVTNILTKNEIKEILDQIKKIFQFDNKNNSLDKHISLLYERNPVLAGKCYDALNQSAIIQNIFLSKKILKKIAIFHGLKTTSQIAFADFQFLIMLPSKKKREYLGWHQDSKYFEVSKSKKSSIICWTSISSSSNKVNGALSVMPGSHNLGRIHHIKNSKSKIKKNSSKRKGKFYISEDKINKFKAKNCFINSGQSIVFDSHLVHRSGPTLSNNNSIRFTIITRYKNILKLLLD